jgi:hypothetical protein
VRNVNLREGGSESVILEMGVTAVVPVTTSSAPTAAPQITAAPTATATGNEKPGGLGIPTISIAAYGVGAAGLVAGAVFGGLTLGKYNDYNAKPTRADLDQGRLFGLVADIGFGTAVVGAAVGTVYWLVARPSGGAKPPPAKGEILVTPAVGSTGGGVSVSGRF